MMTLYFLWLLGIGLSNQEIPSEHQSSAEVYYGQAEAAQVVQVLPDFCLVCNIRNYPPVVGEKMPVYIRGLQAAGTQADSKVQTYLQTLLCKQPQDPNQAIVLKNIQRGETFCLIADIEINRRDIGDYLVEQGLVERILKAPVSEQDAPPSTEPPAKQPTVLQPKAPPALTIAPGPMPTQGYIASKGSRIFHRIGCPHINRIGEAQRMYFRTREEAASGRRPCKTCNP